MGSEHTLRILLILTENITACLGQTQRIAGNFQGRKLSWIGEKYDFHRENFCRLLACAMPKDTTPPNFEEKVSQITTKLRNYFLSRKFPAIWYWSRRILEWHTTPPPYLHCITHHSDLSFSPECCLSTLHGLLTGSPCASPRPETFWRPRSKQSLVYTTVY